MTTRNRIDIGAMVLSGLCVAHCLALPLLVAMLPLGAYFGFEDRHFHWVMLVFALPLSIAGLTQGFLRHQRRFIPAIGAVGLLLMAWDLMPDLAPHDHGLTVPGVLLVATAHAFNIRALRQLATDAP
ncbi:MAG TPA: MerC domain-containing protein [Pseudomonadales bacterium]|nr:MerC domain-containing protein [Pseudomonadales bacterium]